MVLRFLKVLQVGIKVINCFKKHILILLIYVFLCANINIGVFMKDINILISIDDSYLNHAIDMIYSLSIHNDYFFNIYLVYSDLSDSSIDILSKFISDKKIGVLKLYHFDSSRYNFPLFIDYISVSTYFRLFAPFIIDEDIDRLLYLDCDIICTGDISELYNCDFDDNVFVGCKNMLDVDTSYYNFIFNERLDMSVDDVYINAGVLLINIDKYKNMASMDSILSFINNNKDLLYFQDQDVINKYFYGHIKVVDNKYNYQINGVACGCETFDNCLVHYSESMKPWDPHYSHPNKARDYYNFLRQKGDLKGLRQLINFHFINSANELYDYIVKD